MGSAERIDENDLTIIEMLSKNARSSLREIGSVVDLSPSSIRNRMERLVNLGVIKKYTLELDQRKLGFEVQVVVLITSTPGESDNLYNKLSKYSEITNLLRTSGPANFICMVQVRDIPQLAQFITGELEKLTGVERIETMFILPQNE
ncbi:MAG: HTH-type transcriptional regulator Ptr1 [Candidatus Thorarchaeota archaeon AB_25]|nr:MAG: HTH-type transcriptional regulator Ptr1 [Candidatus Thorarchaeota archaeon AB_25]